MIRRKRLSFVLDLLTLFILVSSLIAGGAWHTSSTAAYAAPRESDLSLESTRQAYELLLDRFVYPIEPSALLSAAWQGAVPALNEAHSTVDLSPPDFSGAGLMPGKCSVIESTRPGPTVTAWISNLV